MRFLVSLFIVLLAVAAFAQVRSGPARGDWLCWATSVENAECGTYGWHKRKPIALEAAMGLCAEVCGKCAEDYCERVSN